MEDYIMESNKNDVEQRQINDAVLEEWGRECDVPRAHKGPNRKTRRSKEFKNAQKRTAAAEAKRIADLSKGANLEVDNEKLAAGVNTDGTCGKPSELC